MSIKQNFILIAILLAITFGVITLVKMTGPKFEFIPQNVQILSINDHVFSAEWFGSFLSSSSGSADGDKVKLAVKFTYKDKQILDDFFIMHSETTLIQNGTLPVELVFVNGECFYYKVNYRYIYSNASDSTCRYLR